LVWDFDQIFKVLKDRLSFQIPDAQHREWFIAGLFPHIFPFDNSKIVTKAEALEISMKLEASPVGESSTGMAQVPVTVSCVDDPVKRFLREKKSTKMYGALIAELKVIIRMNVHLCKQYLNTGAPNPLGPWCEICKTMGHHPHNCPLMQKYQSTMRNLFCNFCKSVGHDEKDCHTFDLMRECTADAYRFQGKNQKEELHSIILPEEVIIKEEEEDSEVVEEVDLAEEEDLLYVIILINLDTWLETV
jgi:hypothetical protein